MLCLPIRDINMTIHGRKSSLQMKMILINSEVNIFRANQYNNDNIRIEGKMRGKEWKSNYNTYCALHCLYLCKMVWKASLSLGLSLHHDFYGHSHFFLVVHFLYKNTLKMIFYICTGIKANINQDEFH